MARRMLIAGNWKMNKTVAESLQLVREIRRLAGTVRDKDILVCPPMLAVHAVAKSLEGSNIHVGAQELYPVDAGAFTGKVSAPMVKEAGASYVLVGHSERREHFGETNEGTAKRVVAALEAGLIPILCVGEQLEQRENGTTMEVVGGQVAAVLDVLDDAQLKQLVIAYEPVWAIGTGKVATPQQAQETHAAIRNIVRTRSADIANNMVMVYGGSVKPANAADIFSGEDIDGALIGGASLQAESFVGIAKA